MWSNFFVAAAGAAAALAGLTIVAISVNINSILAQDNLPSRAAATVADLLLILISSMYALIPQSTHALGLELLFAGILAWLIELRSAQKSLQSSRIHHRPVYERIHILWGQLQTLPFIIGAAVMLLHGPSALYWISAGIITAFILSSLNTWILLVEILR
jgi:hypothetical protein